MCIENESVWFLSFPGDLRDVAQKKRVLTRPRSRRTLRLAQLAFFTFTLKSHHVGMMLAMTFLKGKATGNTEADRQVKRVSFYTNCGTTLFSLQISMPGFKPNQILSSTSIYYRQPAHLVPSANNDTAADYSIIPKTWGNSCSLIFQVLSSWLYPSGHPQALTFMQQTGMIQPSTDAHT